MGLNGTLFISFFLLFSLQAPLDYVLLQSNVPVDLQEVDKSTAVISYTQPNPEVQRRNQHLHIIHLHTCLH